LEGCAKTKNTKKPTNKKKRQGRGTFWCRQRIMKEDGPGPVIDQKKMDKTKKKSGGGKKEENCRLPLRQ